MLLKNMKEYDIYRGCIEPMTVALGFFDCIHKGHKKLIRETIEMANANNAVPALFTFRNNPFIVLGNDSLPVYTYTERLHTLIKNGINHVIYADFDKKFMSMEVNTFYVLLDRFNLKGIVCGYDYSFGRGGLGTPNGLKNYCAERGIEFVCIEPVKMIGERVSSTSIRELLKIGDITLVNMLLGERFIIGGTVIHGDEIGRTIGLPTANLNINIKEKQLPEDGVYCGYTTIDNDIYQCLVHIGGRPTINRDEKRVEVHIKNFEGNLYGRYIYAELSKRIRGIEKFNDIDTLKKQILKDLNENIW